MFPIITPDRQRSFEALATQNERDSIPCICGFCGRGCYQMDKAEGANRSICTTCPLARYADFINRR